MPIARVIAIIQGHDQQSLPVTTSEAVTGRIDAGDYDLWSDVETYVKISGDATGVTASNGYVLFAGNAVTMRIDRGDQIGAIAVGSGTLRYHRVG